MSDVIKFIRIPKNQSKVIYALIIIVMIFSYTNPILLPLNVDLETQAYYNTIVDLPAGKTILLAFAFDSGQWGALGGAAIATLNLLQTKNDKILISPFSSVEGGLMIQRCLGLQKGGYNALGKYGVDWVILPYGPGDETFYAAMMQEPNGMHTAQGNKDYFGTNMENLPIMDNVHSHKDIDLLICIGGAGAGHQVRQFGVPYGIPILVADIAVDWAELKMFIDNGAVKGGIKDAVGSAELEKLIGIPGIATSTVAGLSLNHLLIIGFIVVGNIQYLYGRYKKRGGK